jgi:hypothetical protein
MLSDLLGVQLPPVNTFFLWYTYCYQELMIQIPSPSKAPWRPALRILLRSKSAPF